VRDWRTTFVEQFPLPVCPISIQDHVTEALENQRIIDRNAVNDDWLLRLFRQLVAARANNELRTPLRIGLTKGQCLKYVNMAGDDHRDVGGKDFANGLLQDSIVDLVFSGRLIASDGIERRMGK
jgi:hypothetical protein